MRPDEREVLIRYRLEQAYSALRQAEILAREAEWSGVVNRAYYAMFYASLALLLRIFWISWSRWTLTPGIRLTRIECSGRSTRSVVKT
ncbi:MAG: HEPN domain-containing protein [Clostridia bacterium]